MATRGKTDTERFPDGLDVHGPQPAFNGDGVDLTQIRQALDMTPVERVRLVSRWATAILRARVVDGR